MQQAAKEGWPNTDFVHRPMERELVPRKDQSLETRVRPPKLPMIKMRPIRPRCPLRCRSAADRGAFHAEPSRSAQTTCPSCTFQARVDPVPAQILSHVLGEGYRAYFRALGKLLAGFKESSRP